MSETAWEERMAERAKLRRESTSETETAEWSTPTEVDLAIIESRYQEARTRTLADLARPRPGCACVGPMPNCHFCPCDQGRRGLVRALEEADLQIKISDDPC